MANYTQNYQLHQWAPQDPFLRTDFNQDLQKIDTALGQLAEATAGIGSLGNCEISHTTYTGDGAFSRTQTFPGKPMVVMVARADQGYSFIAWRGMEVVLPHHQQYGTIKLSMIWEGNALSWSNENNAERVLNMTGALYQVIALLDMSI